ncbi:MAG TPA: hypothetical protein PKW35_21425 [Nannocystaceae bacterium]|nr:hypothetical protein [Nannocystaceae bacterium]
MNHALFSDLAGQRHRLGALVLMRGETLMEVVEPGGLAVVVILRGTASISRQRAGEQAGIHLTPRRGEPVWLTSPGTYCVVAKDHVFGLRLLKSGGPP